MEEIKWHKCHATSALFIVHLGPAYNEFGYNEHPAITSRFLGDKIIHSSVEKFGYNEHPFITSSSFCIFILSVSETQCNTFIKT